MTTNQTPASPGIPEAMDERAAPEVLPCPFCGHVGLDFGEGSTFRWIIAGCAGCGASTGETRIQTFGEGTRDEWMADARADAIAAWNRRANLPPPQGGKSINHGSPAMFVFISEHGGIRYWTRDAAAAARRAKEFGVEPERLYSEPKSPPQGDATWIRNAALKEAYEAMFDIKGDKATRFDAQTAIRNLVSGAAGQTPGGQEP